MLPVILFLNDDEFFSLKIALILANSADPDANRLKIYNIVIDMRLKFIVFFPGDTMHLLSPDEVGGYSFGVVRPSIPSVYTFCLSGTISQYLLVRFDLFLVQMISTMNSRYPISLVKIDPLTLELLPLFKYRQL